MLTGLFIYNISKDSIILVNKGDNSKDSIILVNKGDNSKDFMQLLFEHKYLYFVTDLWIAHSYILVYY